MIDVRFSPNQNGGTNTTIAASASQRIAIGNGSVVLFAVGTKGLWYKFGSSTVEATAGTAAEGFIPQETLVYLPVPRGATHIAIIQSAATSIGSISVYT